MAHVKRRKIPLCSCCGTPVPKDSRHQAWGPCPYCSIFACKAEPECQIADPEYQKVANHCVQHKSCPGPTVESFFKINGFR